MKIGIRKKDVGSVISEFTVTYISLNETCSLEDWFNEAWKSAVEDKLVINDERSKYDFFVS
jgi:hypothetical protein